MMRGAVNLKNSLKNYCRICAESVVMYAVAFCALACLVPVKLTLANTIPVADKRVNATITAVNLSNKSLHQIPMTFGQPFRTDDIPHGNTIVAYLDGKPLPTQADIKARNPDGSVRHAVLTVMLPALAGSASETLMLRPTKTASITKTGSLTLGDLLRSSFDVNARFNISGQFWHLDARSLLEQVWHSHRCRSYGRKCSLWLSGPLVSEWVVGGPIVNVKGQPHPHLAVYFAVRAYGPAPVKRVRVDVIVENDWAYVPDPHNISYSAEIQVAGQKIYRINKLDHYRQTRWHKLFWWGEPDPVYAQQNSLYLQDSLAVPRYENIKLSNRVLDQATQRVHQLCGPMRRCDQSKDMSTVGAQPGIGPLPRWSSFYVIDTKYRAFRWMLANSDALGSYRVHYRDIVSGQTVSVEEHPCATLILPAEVQRCRVPPHANDNFPRCKAQCKSPLAANEAHHPSPAYVAYLVTGDWYYLEELKFWADWVVFQQNPTYRDYAKGLFYGYTLRGQGWALRTLGYAAYILPDNDPFKHYFNRVVENNIGWYNAKYTDNPNSNSLHIITNGYALSYPDNGRGPPNTGTATWQVSFFTWAVGNLKDLGFNGANKLLNWVAAFQVNLITSPDFCWILASTYEVQVRDTEKSPIYKSVKDVYANTFPQFKDVKCNSDEMAALLSKHHGYRYTPGAMVGYPQSPTGFPANFQIGLAAAADSNIPGAHRAWEKFENAKVKPNYIDSPQFAVVPRK